jgi:hypothetical protein
MKEVYIIRNNDVPSLYNVVVVDMEKEDARMVQSLIPFDEAQIVKEAQELLLEEEVAL